MQSIKRIFCYLISGSSFSIAQQQINNGTSCNENIFYGIEGQYIIRLALPGSSISIVDTVQSYSGQSIANANTNGTFSPTFYSEILPGSIPAYYDGVQWVAIPSGSAMANCGGHGNHIYYILNSPTSQIYKLVNGNFMPFFTLNQGIFAVADIAVDPSGNAYVFTRINDQTFMTDSLIVIAPSGSVLLRFPFVRDMEHGYGSFYHNSFVYVGLGFQNSISPNSLLPIPITGGIPVASTPIPMPSAYWGDLASCSNVNRVDLPKIEMQSFNVYPNPVRTELNIDFEFESPRRFIITDLLGEEQMNFCTDLMHVLLERKNLPSGIYLLKIEDLHNQKKEFIKLVME